MPLQPCLVLPQLPRAQAVDTHPSCLPVGAACTNTLQANHPSSWQRSGASSGFSNSFLHTAALLPSASIITQQKMKDQKNTGTLGQEWGEPQLLSQGLTKGL